jgi:hypothetical protein
MKTITKSVSLLNRLLLSNIKIESKVEETLKILVKKIESLGVFVCIGNPFN